MGHIFLQCWLGRPQYKYVWWDVEPYSTQLKFSLKFVNFSRKYKRKRMGCFFAGTQCILFYCCFASLH